MSCVPSSSRENSSDDSYGGISPKRSRPKKSYYKPVGDIARKRKGTRKRGLLSHIFKRRSSSPLQEVPDIDEAEDTIPLENVPGALDLSEPYIDDLDDYIVPLLPQENIGHPVSITSPAGAPTPSSQATVPHRFREPCQSCNSGFISYPSIKAALIEKNGIFKFKSEDGKYIYSHIKFPENHRPLSHTSDTTLRRRADLMDALLSLIVAEEDDTQSVKSKAKLIWKYLQRNPGVQKIVRQEIKKTSQEIIPTRTAARLVTQLVVSKNKGEKLMSTINEETLAKIGRVFGSRDDYRAYMKSCELGAVYKSKTVHVYLEDKIESMPVAYMKNIKDVLIQYVHRLQDKMEISERTENSLYLRLGLDKGGLDTKLSLSFANCQRDQSPYNQLVVAAYTGPDHYLFLREAASKTLEKIENIKDLKINGKTIPVKLFLVGDNMSLSALIGHSGPCCTNPCQICTVELSALRKKVDDPDWKMRSKPAFGEGINKKPLIRVPPSNIVPPILHDFVGPSTTLLQLIIDDSTYIDQQLLTKKPIIKEDLPSQQVKRTLVKPSGMLPIKELEKRKKIITDFRQAEKKGDSKKKKKEESDETCILEWCYKKIGVKVPKALSTMSTCENCQKQHHLVCNGIVDPQPDLDNFICAKCASGNDTTCESLFKNVLDDLENSYALAQYVLNESKKSGFVGHLDRFMKRHHIDRQLYQGGILRGNDAHRLVQKIDEALEKFVSFQHNDPAQEQIVKDRGEAYLTLGQALYRINSLCTNKFLGADQLDTLKTQIDKFSTGIKLIPGFHLTVKCHHLKAHFYDFAERWKTLGKFSESYIESGHVHWNRLSLNVGNRPRGGYRLRYLIRNVNSRAVVLFQGDIDEDLDENPEEDEND